MASRLLSEGEEEVASLKWEKDWDLETEVDLLKDVSKALKEPTPAQSVHTVVKKSCRSLKDSILLGKRLLLSAFLVTSGPYCGGGGGGDGGGGSGDGGGGSGDGGGGGVCVLVTANLNVLRSLCFHQIFLFQCLQLFFSASIIISMEGFILEKIHCKYNQMCSNK